MRGKSMLTDDAVREEWSSANRRMTDAALQVARWVELHPGASCNHKALYLLKIEYVEARRVVLELIAADRAPAPAVQRSHLSLVR